MKKLLSLALILALVLSMTFAFTACDGGGGTTTTTAPPETQAPAATTAPPTSTTQTTEPPATTETPMDTTTFTAGIAAGINGDFIAGFGNSSYDKYMRDLMGESNYYGTVRTLGDGSYIVNPVTVKEMKDEVDAEGNKTFTFTLHEDLKWSDGSALNANDYVFSILWSESPQWRAAGATAGASDIFLGYEEYNQPDLAVEEIGAETNFFAGVKLIDDYNFSVTVTAENLPYFYEIIFARVDPSPMAYWAPGATIESTDEGSRITGVDLLACANNVATVERFAPRVVCGPYMFVDFSNQIVTLTKNPYFKGDYDGSMPQFENIVFKSVANDTEVQMVINGELDLTTGVIEGSKIEAAKASDTADLHSYLRNGYGLIAFHCDWGPTADVNVRWGIASLVDRNEVINYVLGGYGGAVDSEYGYAQWMYQERKSELLSKITPISYNIDKANEYFDQSEYKYEADGVTPFDKSKANADGTYLRHNAAGEPFVIHHFGPDTTSVTGTIEIVMKASAPLAGLEFQITAGDFAALLDNYYYGYERGEDRYFNSFNLASNFGDPFDPYYASYHSDYYGTHVNSNQVNDEELDRAIMAMRNLGADERDAYLDNWIAYQVRWNQLLPNVPLYSNEYFDIYNTRVTGLQSTPFLTWAQTICSLRLA